MDEMCFNDNSNDDDFGRSHSETTRLELNPCPRIMLAKQQLRNQMRAAVATNKESSMVPNTKRPTCIARTLPDYRAFNETFRKCWLH